MLYLIGLGLDWKDISLKAMEAVSKCSLVYLEAYTSVAGYPVEKLSHLIKRKIIVLKREGVEQDRVFLKEAKSRNVALLIYGDPLSATTHLEILEDCKKSKIKYEVIHAPSVFTAIAETGLQLYKFGKVASIPFWERGFEPKSFFEVFVYNVRIGAHTLFLLDLKPSERKFLSIPAAINILLTVAENQGVESLFNTKTLCVGCARLGTDKVKIIAGEAGKLMTANFGRPPYCLIVPSKLHFIEEEFLEEWK